MKLLKLLFFNHFGRGEDGGGGEGGTAESLLSVIVAPFSKID